MTIDEALNAGAGQYLAGERTHTQTTDWQRLEIFDTPVFGKLMRLDGCNMTSEGDEFFYHEALIHPALIAHPSPRKALIIGGGDGGSARQVLMHPSIVQVDLVELDRAVIAAARLHFTQVHQGALDHPKLKVTIGDGLAFLADCLAHKKSNDQGYDFIALDLTDPSPNPDSGVQPGVAASLYSAATFRMCAAALAPGGALALHVGSPVFHPARFVSTLRQLSEVFAHVSAYLNYVPIYGAEWGFAVASATLVPSACSAAQIESTLIERRLTGLQLYNPGKHTAMFALPNYVQALMVNGAAL